MQQKTSSKNINYSRNDSRCIQVSWESPSSSDLGVFWVGEERTVTFMFISWRRAFQHDTREQRESLHMTSCQRLCNSSSSSSLHTDGGNHCGSPDAP